MRLAQQWHHPLARCALKVSTMSRPVRHSATRKAALVALALGQSESSVVFAAPCPSCPSCNGQKQPRDSRPIAFLGTCSIQWNRTEIPLSCLSSASTSLIHFQSIDHLIVRLQHRQSMRFGGPGPPYVTNKDETEITPLTRYRHIVAT